MSALSGARLGSSGAIPDDARPGSGEGLFPLGFAIGSAWLIPLAFALAFPEVYRAAGSLLSRDNRLYHGPMFRFVAEWIRSAGSLPDWYFTRSGGVWLEPLTNNYLLLAPYKLAGWILALAGMNADAAYKISTLVIGQGLFLTGAALAARAAYGRAGILLAPLLAVSGASVTIAHQEQTLGTLQFLPWILLSALRGRVALGGWLLGLAMNSHYPQLLTGFGLALAIGAILETRAFGGNGEATSAFVTGWLHRNRIPLATAAALFLLGASPLLYTIAHYAPRLASPFRESDSIAPSDFDAYLRMNTLGASSVEPENLGLYLGLPESGRIPMAWADGGLLHVNPGIALLLGLAFAFPFPWKRLQLASAAILAILSLGIHGPAAEPLWWFWPGTRVFRQWFHFAGILDFSLVLLGVAALRAWDRRPVAESWRKRVLVAVALGASALAFGAWGENWLWVLGHGGSAILLGLAARGWPHVNGTRDRARVAVAAFLVVTGFAWAWQRNADYARATIQVGDPYRDEPRRFGADLLLAGTFAANPLPDRTLVAPMGADEKRILSLAGTRWIERDGTPSDALGVGAGWEEGRLAFSVPSPVSGRRLTLSQWNDGRWEARDPGGREIPLESTPWGTLRFSEGATRVHLDRRPTVWRWLALASFLPGICFAWLGIRGKRRLSASKARP